MPQQMADRALCIGGLTHQAFVYDSADDLVSRMVPLLRDALDRGDHAFAAITSEKLAALREGLGDDAERVRLEDAAEWEVNPFGRLQAFRAMVAELPPGRGLSAIGEPLWHGSPAVRRQWARYESIVNLALADAPMRFVCVYDGAGLPDEILDVAAATHPRRLEHGGAAVSSGAYVANGRYEPAEPHAPPPDAVELPLEGHELRERLGACARTAGISGDDLDKLALAASEVAANALLHGGDPIEATTWTRDGEIVCRVADGGPGIGPLDGWLLPPRGATSGWGLPLARQLCDAVDVARTDGRTVVTLHMAGADGKD